MAIKHMGPGRPVGPGKSAAPRAPKAGPVKGNAAAAARGHAAKAVARLNHEVRHEKPLQNWGAAKGAGVPGAGDIYRDPAPLGPTSSRGRGC